MKGKRHDEEARDKSIITCPPSPLHPFPPEPGAGPTLSRLFCKGSLITLDAEAFFNLSNPNAETSRNTLETENLKPQANNPTLNPQPETRTPKHLGVSEN